MTGNLADLAAQVTGSIASVVILVLATSNAVHNDRSVLGSESGLRSAAVHGDREVFRVVGRIGYGQGIGAGGGSILNLHGSGEEELVGVTGAGGTSCEHHHQVFAIAGSIINRDILGESDVLVGGGVVLASNLDRGNPSLFVLIKVSGDLENIHIQIDLDLQTDDTGSGDVLQIDLDQELITGVQLGNGLLVHIEGQDLDIKIISSGYGSERNHSTQHQHRQKNC